jgi:cyclopropane fatty-acyl-phospholipid synthase-like methyltransferase
MDEEDGLEDSPANLDRSLGQAELERWNRRFSDPDYIFGTEPNAFLAAQAHLLKRGQTALAVADGEGRNGVWLAEQGLDVTSFDFSPVGLEKARALAGRRGVKLHARLADAAAWEWQPERFDVVVAIFIQFAGPELRDAIFAGIRRTLVPGGLLLLQGYRPEQLIYGTGGPSCAENMYTSALLRSAFDGFEIVSLEEHDSMTSEGKGHHGMAALIDLVARKPG